MARHCSGPWRHAAGHRGRAVLNAAAGELLRLLFPPVCVLCEALLLPASRHLACATCWSSLAPLPRPRCNRCGHPGLGACRWCRQVHADVRFGRSFCWASQPTARRLLHALKYGGWHAVASEMAARMATLDVPRVEGEPIVLVPVPLALAKERVRGYNQSRTLADALALRWGVGVSPALLTRIRDTPSQTRLTAEQRWHNVANAFRVDPEELARHGRSCLVLVDDVVTTGATLNACAGALAGAGAGPIGFITFGRAPDPGDRSPP